MSHSFFLKVASCDEKEGESAIKWFNEFLPYLPFEARASLKAVSASLSLFSRLLGKSPAEISGWLEESSIPPFRAIGLFVRLLSYMALYSSEEAERETGFSPACEPSFLRQHEINKQVEYPGKSISADVIVIGSGAGGAPSAYEFAKAGFEVAILEEGTHWYSGEEFKSLPVMEVVKNLYHGMGLFFTYGNTFILLPTAKGVGGTTTVNSGTCFRIPENVLREWKQEYGLKAFTDDEIEKMFDQVEKDLKVGYVPRDVLGRNSEIVERGAEALGFNFRPLRRNAPGCMGCGRCVFGCVADAKSSTNVSYIPMAVSRGAKVYTGVKVKKLLVEEGRVKGGVAVNVRTGEQIMISGKIFVLAAGALRTPGILRKSGISGKYISKRLTIHPATRVLALMDERVEGWKGVPQGGYIDDLAHKGIMFEGIFAPPFAMAINFPYSGKDLREKMKDEFPHISAFGVMVSERDSEGKIYYTGEKPFVLYNLGRGDLNALLEGIVTLARVYFGAGAKKVYLPLRKHHVIKSEDELNKVEFSKVKPSDIELGAFHPKGTVFAGSEGTGAPCTEEGKVRGVKNLLVVDTSFMPTSLGVNPQLTCMVFSRLFSRRAIERGI